MSSCHKTAGSSIFGENIDSGHLQIGDGLTTAAPGGGSDVLLKWFWIYGDV